MRTAHARRLTALCLPLLVVLGRAPAAYAVGEGLGWTAPDYLSSEGRSALAPSLGLLSTDAPVAAWAEQTNDGWFPVMASRPVAGNWSEPTAIADGPIDAPSPYSFGPRVAWSANGNYVGAWLVHRDQAKGDGSFVNQAVVEGATGAVAAGAPAGHTPYFFAGRHPPNGYTYDHTPEVLLNAGGAGVVAYFYRNCCGGEYLGSTAIVGGNPLGTPGDPQTSLVSAYGQGTNDDFNPSNPPTAVAGRSQGWFSPANELVASITTRVGYVTDPLKAEIRTTANPASWPSSGTVAPLPGFGAALGILADGRILATAPSGDGRLLMWRTGESTATTIDDDIGSSAFNKATIATFSDSSATIAYMADDAEHGVFRIRAVTVTATGSISAPVTLSGPEAVARNPAVAYAPDGTVHVVWSQGAGVIGAEVGGPGTGVYASYRLPDADFPATATPVIDGIAAAQVPKIIVASDGFATVVAQINDGTRWRIAAFTHANPAIPKSITPPEISYDGEPTAGTQLTASTGTWTADPTSYLFEWRIDGVPVAVASAAPTFTVRPADVGHVVTCRVTASNQAGSGMADSAALQLGASNVVDVDPVVALDKKGTTASLTATTPGPGTLRAHPAAPAGTLAEGRAGASAAARKPQKHPPLIGETSLHVDAAGPATLTVSLTPAGRKQFRKKAKKGLVVPVEIGFTPDGGSEGVQTIEVTFKKPRKPKP